PWSLGTEGTVLSFHSPEGHVARGHIRCRCLTVAFGFAVSSGLAVADEDSIVVTGVTPGLAAEKAGLHEGDHLSRWRQGENSGQLSSPFGLMQVEIERGPRGPVDIEATRDGAPFAVSLFPDEWGLETRPALEAKPLEAYEAARRAAGDEARVAALQGLAAQLRGAGPEPSAGALLQLARAELRASPDVARRAVQDAAATAAQPGVQALVHAAFAEALRQAGKLAEAAASYEQALRLEESIDPEGLGLARIIEGSGFVAYARLKDLPQAHTRLEPAGRLVESQAPRSLAHARALHALAQTLDSSVEARQVLQRAAALATDLAPGSLTLASILYTQAWVTPGEEQLTLIRQALEIRERLAPDSEELGDALGTLGLVLENRGMLDEARTAFQQAIA